MPDVTLAPFQPDRDLPRLAAWLDLPHVARGWGEPAAVLADLGSRRDDTVALILRAGEPVGVLCWQTLTPAERDAAGLGALPADLVDVDILIGTPDALGQGIGPAALALLFDRLARAGATQIGMATALRNRRALAAFARVGLVAYRDFTADGEAYRYLTRQLG